MTWDPRDLGAPRRTTHPPAPPEPPAPPPRSYELRLADWDDARVTAERAGLRFNTAMPLPAKDDAEIALYTDALKAEIGRSLFSQVYPGNPDKIPAIPQFLPVDLYRQPLPIDSFLFKPVYETDEQVRKRIEERWSAPFSAEIVHPVEQLPDGITRVELRLPSAKTMNAATQRFCDPIDFGDCARAAMDRNHRAIIGAQGADPSEAPQTPARMNGPTGPWEPVGDDYPGADWD